MMTSLATDSPILTGNIRENNIHFSKISSSYRQDRKWWTTSASWSGSENSVPWRCVILVPRQSHVQPRPYVLPSVKLNFLSSPAGNMGLFTQCSEWKYNILANYVMKNLFVEWKRYQKLFMSEKYTEVIHAYYRKKIYCIAWPVKIWWSFTIGKFLNLSPFSGCSSIPPSTISGMKWSDAWRLYNNHIVTTNIISI